MRFTAEFTMCGIAIVVLYKIPFGDLLVQYHHFNREYKVAEVVFPETALSKLGIVKIIELGAHYHDVDDGRYRFSEELLTLPIPRPHPGLEKAVKAIGQKLYWPCCWMGEIQVEEAEISRVDISKGSLPSTVDINYDHLFRARDVPVHLIDHLLQAAKTAKATYVRIIVNHSEMEAILEAWGHTFHFPSAEAAITALLLGNVSME